MAPTPPEDEGGRTVAPTAQANGQRLVVIDDSELACALVQEGLSAQGYEVTCFNDPFLALEQVDVLKPDLVLTDLDMPGMDGGEVCRRLKHGPRISVPVIILTANDADERRVKGLREGADDYVNKGASMEELAARVETVLRRTRETERVRRLFARYTSDAVVEEILRTGEVNLTGEKRDVTVLFADIRNFTAFAESRPPEEVMRVLNEVLGRLADSVLEWGGTLDKFLGDGLMAVWGAPVKHDDDAASAVSAALRMMEEFRAQQHLDPDAPKFELGIGLNTGPVLAGSLGSARRTEYTCIGDTVNVASRLCALAGPGEILVGEGTARALEHVGPLEPLSPVRVKGKAQPVPLFRVTPQLDEALAAQRRF
jgi:adenylate cyclase